MVFLGENFAPAPVDDDRRVDVDMLVVEEFHDCERQDDHNRVRSHCKSKFLFTSYGCTHETLSIPYVFQL